MYNINLPGLPDFSNFDFSNIDLSQFGVPTPAGIAPVQPPLLQEAPAPAPLPVTAVDPYAGMTRADLAEIGVFMPPPAMVAPPVQTPAPAPAPAPVQPAPLMGIEGLAPNFAMTEDFARPVGRGSAMPAIAAPTPAPQVAPAPVMSEPPQPVPSPTPAPEFSFDPASLDLSGLDFSNQNYLLGNFAGTPQPTPTPTAAPATTFRDTPAMRATGEDFALPADQEAFMGAREPVDFNPYSPEMNAETLMGTPDTPNVNNVAQSLINTGPITLPNGETFDIRNLDLSGLNLSGFSPPQEAIDEAQGTTPAQAARAGEDLAQIPDRGNVNPRDYYVPVPDFYTDGQFADRGFEPGNTINLIRGGENPQQPAGTPLNISPAGTPLNISPEQQAAIDNWLANNPPGTVINIPGGGSVTVPGYTGGTGSTGSTRTVNPNDLMLQNLQIQQGQSGRGGSVATQFGLRGTAPTQPVERGNPFRRPGDEGIASLVPSGG